MDDREVSFAIKEFERDLNIPVTDALTRPTSRLIDMVIGAFPELIRIPAALAT